MNVGGPPRASRTYFVLPVRAPALRFEDGQEQRPVGIWGQRHLWYIRERRIALYTELLTSGRLNTYLKKLAEKESVTEALKAEDGMKWVQAMNSIRSRAAEVVYNDLIYNRYPFNREFPLSADGVFPFQWVFKKS